MAKNWLTYWGKQLLIGIFLVIVFFTRLAKLERVPAGATVDEVNYGYIAYSLLKTGKDEHGVAWPLVFQAYGDQKLPGQAYLLVPFVEALGLNNLAIRLPSALASCILVVMAYYLVRAWGFSEKTGWIIAVLWAVSPAPYLLGRGAWESNLALLGLVIGLFGLGQLLQLPIPSSSATKPQRHAWRRAWLAWAVGFAFAWYCYVPYRLITGIIWLLVGLTTCTPLWGWYTRRRPLFTGIVAGVILVCPLLLFTHTRSNFARLSQVGGDQLAGLVMEIDEKRTFCVLQGHFPRAWCDLVFNKATVGGRTWLAGWLSTLGVDFLALTGEENPVYNVGGFGQVTPVAYLLAWLGLIPLAQAISQRSLRRGFAWLLLILLIVSVTPAVIVGVQKVRLSALFPVIFLLAAWGIDFATVWYRAGLSGWQRWGKLALLVFLAAWTLGDWLIFMTTYFGYHYYKNDWETLAQVPRIDAALAQLEPDQIYWHVNYPDALMFFAYDTAFKPKTYQNEIVLSAPEPGGWQHPMSLSGRYFISEQSVKSKACDPEASWSGTAVFVEQDGKLIEEIDQYVTSEETAVTPTALAIKNWRAPVAIRSVNGANLLAYIVDLNWYRDVWCGREGAE